MQNEKIDLLAAFTEKQLLNELFRRNLVMEAHVQTLHGAVTVLMAKVYGKTEKEVVDELLDQISERSKKIFETNEMLVAARKGSKKQ